jgi:cyclohexyl-isocyanide hydratase
MNTEQPLSRRELGATAARTGLAAAMSALLPHFAGAEERPESAPANGPDEQMHAALLIYPQMTALDLVGPLQILTAMGSVQTHLVWKRRDIIVTDSGMPVQPTKSFDECPANLTILFAPGGSTGTVAAMNDDAVLDFLAEKGKSAKYVTSVCTGALLLGAAGLLQGYKATTHWLAHDILKMLGAEPVKARVVEDRNRLTGAGVTAGIDFGLRLAARLQTPQQAKAIQLLLEYDPQPPFAAGSPEGAGKEISEGMRRSSAPLLAMMRTAAQRTSKRRS